jgi:hypothetical protein
MQWCELTELIDCLLDRGIDAAGGGKTLPAVHDTVADGFERLHPRTRCELSQQFRGGQLRTVQMLFGHGPITLVVTRQAHRRAADVDGQQAHRSAAARTPRNRGSAINTRASMRVVCTSRAR